MLVLSRRESERIKLGDSIVVTVVRFSGDRVRLGIEAPADVRVLRCELEPKGTRPRPMAEPGPPLPTNLRSVPGEGRGEGKLLQTLLSHQYPSPQSPRYRSVSGRLPVIRPPLHALVFMAA